MHNTNAFCRGPIVLIDKPPGITSFDVIRILRKHCGVRKMGHAGTLDPLATGLLVVGIGAGTKQLASLVGLTKTYEAEVLLGMRTATGDLEGRIMKEKEVGDEVTSESIACALLEMTGIFPLPVPFYSAVKVRGTPLYRAARSGTSVVLPQKKMQVLNAVLRSVEREGSYKVARIEWTVGSGTYIRSLAEELGRRLGYPATLKLLRRTRVGDMRVEDAISLRGPMLQ